MWAEMVCQKVVTSWSPSTIRDCVGNKKTRKKTAEMLAGSIGLGLYVHKCLCGLLVGKIMAGLPVVWC